MLQCPKCKSVEDFCELPNLETGEVIKYYCNKCKYESQQPPVEEELVDFQNQVVMDT